MRNQEAVTNRETFPQHFWLIVGSLHATATALGLKLMEEVTRRQVSTPAGLVEAVTEQLPSRRTI